MGVQSYPSDHVELSEHVDTLRASDIMNVGVYITEMRQGKSKFEENCWDKGLELLLRYRAATTLATF